MRQLRSARRALVLTAATGAVAAAALSTTAGPSSASAGQTKVAAVSPTVTAPTTSTPQVTKVLTFIEENHSLAQMQASMPYTNSLAKTYGYATSYSAITHPSLPNYLAIAGGSTFGVTDDNAPSAHKLSGQSIFGQALAAGKTAGVYADGMPSNCYQTNGGTGYAVKHNPWAYFASTTERNGCKAHDKPVTALQSDITNGTLPNAGMVIPNLSHDAHDGSLATADSWFKTKMQAIMAGPDWQAGRLAVVLTADEDDRNSGNRVLTVVIHPSQHAHVVSTSLTHYSLTRLYSQVIGATTYLGKASTAPDMASAFNLPVSPDVTPPTVTGTPKVTKLLTFIEENHSIAKMQAEMPYTNSLATTYGYATNYSAITHPSLPNYLAIAGGGTFGITDDNPPSSHPLSGHSVQSVFGQALAAGKTAGVYADGMPSNCAQTNGGYGYAVRHNPWAYFASTTERNGCKAHDKPVTALQSDITHGTLPNAGMVIPNLCHDAHNCSLGTADSWFKAKMQAIMAGPDWQSGTLAVVLTADEPDQSSGKQVLSVVIHPSQHAHVVSTSLTHFSLARLYSQVTGTSTYLRKASTAPDMASAFGLPVG